MDSIRSNGNPRCCDLYSNYGLCCAFPFGMATLMLGVLKRTLSHMWLSRNLPTFLLRVALFTLMKNDSLINLVMSWPSLPIMLKLSWLNWCPVSWLWTITNGWKLVYDQPKFCFWESTEKFQVVIIWMLIYIGINFQPNIFQTSRTFVRKLYHSLATIRNKLTIIITQLRIF